MLFNLALIPLQMRELIRPSPQPHTQPHIYCQKVLSLAILEGLLTTSHSLALSHYWPTRGLLAAGFPPWPISPLLSQPDPLRLPGGVHVDASLSVDAGSTWTSDHQGSPLQAIPQNVPPSSCITKACQGSRRYLRAINCQHMKTIKCFPFPLRKLLSLKHFPQLLHASSVLILVIILLIFW